MIIKILIKADVSDDEGAVVDDESETRCFRCEDCGENYDVEVDDGD